MFQLQSELVDKPQELGPNSHDHISDVVFPSGDVCDCPAAVSDGNLRHVFDLVELFKTGNVALVDILDIVLVDEALLALERLFLARVEVEGAAVDRAPFAQLGRGSRAFRLNHRLDNVQGVFHSGMLHQRVHGDWEVVEGGGAGFTFF